MHHSNAFPRRPSRKRVTSDYARQVAKGEERKKWYTQNKSSNLIMNDNISFSHSFRRCVLALRAYGLQINKTITRVYGPS